MKYTPSSHDDEVDTRGKAKN